MKQAVFIINSLQNGGAERVVTTQADYLQEMGIQVTIICLRRRIEYRLHPGVKVVCLTENEEFKKYCYVTKRKVLVGKLNQTLDSIYQNGNVVLLTSHLLYPNFITRISRYSEHTIYVLHAFQNIVPGSSSVLYKKFIRWLYGREKVVCISDVVKNEMEKVYGIFGPSIKTIHNPMNFRQIDKAMEQPVDFEQPFILYCGRLSKVKRPDRMLDAYYQGGFYKNYRLVILGIGAWKKILKKRAEKYGIGDRLYFGGWEENVYRWMSRASLLVLTSDSEGMAMVLGEALYCGCPVVSVNCQGPAELLTGELAPYLCEADVASIVETMKTALEQYPSELEKYTEQFAVENNVEKYLAAYREWNMGT